MLARAPPHPGKKNVMMPITHFEIDRHICIVEPLMSRSLFEGLPEARKPRQSLAQIQTVIAQLLETLAFLHANRIVHCDVKPDNVLIVSEGLGDIRLIDFGSAMAEHGSHQQYIQSRFYRSIEVMLGLSVNTQIDLWSVGCMAAEWFLDFAIFASESEEDSVPCIVGMLGDIPDYLLMKSTGWRKFYELTLDDGFRLKVRPDVALMNRHLYHSIFKNSGLMKLNDLLLAKFHLDDEEDAVAVKCFSHFVHSLLTYDPKRRITAEEALLHPFITGEKFSDTYRRPESRKTRHPGGYSHAREPSRVTPKNPLSTIDFLSLI
jgi:dual specificity protein kinase YAK1